MIKANELRIGNWVEFSPNKKISRYCKVISVGESGIVVLDKGLSLTTEFEPIPLTPEILEKAGFVKHRNSNEYWTHWVSKNRWHLSESHHTERSAGVEQGMFYWGESYTEIKFMHQLQNLYFALTGEELEINL